MTAPADFDLQEAMDAVAVPGVVVAHRRIADGDELALLPEEAIGFEGSVLKVRRASGAARSVARDLLQRLGQQRQAILRSVSRMPIWPDGIVGSLAHDSEFAVAALAMRRDFAGVGIDVEPAEMLEPELLGLIATAGERERLHDDPCGGRLLFSVKEAVYKAVNPLDGVFLDHHDVDVDLAAGTAVIRNGRTVRFRCCVVPRIVTLAFVPL
jgi:4'-phosphopantetheinyl transferase EntD